MPSLTVQGGKYCLLHIALLKVTRYVTLLNPTVISQLSYDLTFSQPSRQSITPFSLKPSWLPGHYIHQVSVLSSAICLQVPLHFPLYELKSALEPSLLPFSSPSTLSPLETLLRLCLSSPSICWYSQTSNLDRFSKCQCQTLYHGLHVCPLKYLIAC